MNLSKNDIANDFNFIARALKNEDVIIPSFLSCITPGAVFMIGMTAWQTFIAYPMGYLSKMERLISQGSIGLSLVLSFMMLITITSIRGQYLSIPKGIREQSLVIRLMRRKVYFYIGFWIILNLLAGLTIKLLSQPAIISYVVQLVSILILWFVALADFSRYQISAITAAIKAWRNGGEQSIDLIKI